MFFQSAFQIIMCCKSLSTFIFKVNLKLDFIENLTLFLDCFMSSAPAPLIVFIIPKGPLEVSSELQNRSRASSGSLSLSFLF